MLPTEHPNYAQLLLIAQGAGKSFETEEDLQAVIRMIYASISSGNAETITKLQYDEGVTRRMWDFHMA